jgi:hypothetical protein
LLWTRLSFPKFNHWEPISSVRAAIISARTTVDAARRQLEMMKLSVKQIEGALHVRWAAAGINLLSGRRNQPDQ